ncbi:helix-turn-helix domain-containing protein [Variovorax paradoxus]|nr:helix-turn-helix domain-containing protein [Variovorax paradoxus]
MDHIKALEKGLAVLESFSTDHHRHSASTMAQKAGITRAAARRHLLTLQALGYLETDGQWNLLIAAEIDPAGVRTKTWTTRR